ncbi:MAG: outer membrane protein assembly factor BamA [Ignavibacteriae bacterium]|nr:outer membrane protein assembly factor BamA [Ignavibacteriota bacterium]NOG97930.1 outer membrane protein assembly factor BamA [Ignavibacteriota bacterium]
MKFPEAKYSYLIFLIFFVVNYSFAQENYIVRDITFIGNDTISSDELLARVEHYATGWFADNILFEDPFKFTQVIFERDKERIIKHYQRQGFINAEITDVNFSADDKSETLEIEITINENKPIRVSKTNFEISGNKKIDSIENLKSELLLVEGARFIDEKITNDKNKITNYLINEGYPFVKSDYSLNIDTADNSVKITWQIDAGLRSEFGDIKIEGNKRVEESLILNKVTFNEGDIYNGSALDETQKRIYKLGLFYIVSLSAQLSNSSEKKIPIKIKLEEAPQFNTKIGLGYGRDEKFRASIDQRWLGFLGGARQLKFYAKHSSLEPYHIRLNFLQPDFIWDLTNLSVNNFIIRQTEPGFTLKRFGADFTLQRPIFFDISASIKYSFERSTLDTNSISQVERLKFNINEIYNKSSIELGLERITSDPVFDPDKGSLSSVTLHYSGLGLRSKYHFFRPSIEYRKYIETIDRLILAFRFKAGTIFSYDNDNFIPYEERFYSGGSSSIRGWSRAQLGPKDNEGQPIGGKSIFESNIEFRFPLFWIISGVTFLDYGNVWSSELTFIADELRYASGLGLRVSTPIGPVRLDLAIPVFEGRAQVQYFISVGHAF